MKEKYLEEAVKNVEESTGYGFSDDEIEEVKLYAERKCRFIGKYEGYMPLIIEDELFNYVMSLAISSSYFNKKKRTEGAEYPIGA